VNEREPLLLITGFAITSRVFAPVLDLYASRFECIVFENRGGLVTSMPELAADAARRVRSAGLESAHVYGISMGGMIAQELALRFPERVRGLVLAGTTPGGPRAVRPAVAELARGRWLFSPRFRREHPERVRELLRYFELRPAALWSHWWATVYHDTVSRLGQIQAPTLVMHGGADVMAPVANARLLAERIPDA
jgi:pimeloyl-ACP methyl ester carboxylesterase